MPEKVALIAGASGVTGRALMEHFRAREDWRVLGLASRIHEGADHRRFVAMDLLDPDDCARNGERLAAVVGYWVCAPCQAVVGEEGICFELQYAGQDHK